MIYEENHSFDNLYGGWEGVRGLSDADAAHTTQLGQTGPQLVAPYECLYQDDANLQAQSAANPSAPLSDTCNNTTGGSFPSHFANAPFSIDDYIAPTDITCPPVLSAFSFPNGLRKRASTRNGHWSSRRPLRRLHPRHRAPLLRGAVPAERRAAEPLRAPERRGRPGDGHLRHEEAARLQVPAQPAHPSYAILDNFFQAAFGGSYLNHQWLIAAATAGLQRCNGCPANATHSVLDRNGSPTSVNPPASNQPPGMGARTPRPTAAWSTAC